MSSAHWEKTRPQESLACLFLVDFSSFGSSIQISSILNNYSVLAILCVHLQLESAYCLTVIYPKGQNHSSKKLNTVSFTSKVFIPHMRFDNFASSAAASLAFFAANSRLSTASALHYKKIINFLRFSAF